MFISIFQFFYFINVKSWKSNQIICISKSKKISNQNTQFNSIWFDYSFKLNNEHPDPCYPKWITRWPSNKYSSVVMDIYIYFYILWYHSTFILCGVMILFHCQNIYSNVIIDWFLFWKKKFILEFRRSELFVEENMNFRIKKNEEFLFWKVSKLRYYLILFFFLNKKTLYLTYIRHKRK